MCQCVCFMTTSVGHNEVIGVCRTGPDAEGLGRDHWNEMLAYPRKPITHWHALGEVQACSFPYESYKARLKLLNVRLNCIGVINHNTKQRNHTVDCHIF